MISARILSAIAGATFILVAVSSDVRAQELNVSDYTDLLNSAVSAHSALDGASEDALPALLEEAVLRDTELIEWLDAFLPSPQFQELEAADQAVLINGRSRVEFNRARLLIGLDRCQDARQDLRALLDSPSVDDELRSSLVATYDEATECALRSSHATPEISTTPADAEVAFVEPEPEPASSRKPPTWYEWTLWGVGATGITVGAIAFVNARDIESQIDGIPDGYEMVDSGAEQDEADKRYTIAYVAGGIGIAAAIVGTVLYFTRDAEEAIPAVTWGGSFQADDPFTVSVAF